MTRNDYSALADAIAIERTLQHVYIGDARDSALSAVDDVARAVATVCAKDNPHFDTDRFLIACGVPRDS